MLATAERQHALAALAWMTVGGSGRNPEAGINTPSRSVLMVCGGATGVVVVVFVWFVGFVFF